MTDLYIGKGFEEAFTAQTTIQVYDRKIVTLEETSKRLLAADGPNAKNTIESLLTDKAAVVDSLHVEMSSFKNLVDEGE